MAERGFTPNNNRSVIRQLSSAFGRCNKGRNRILLGTVILSIVTLTMVFGISCGKVRAEYVKAVREAGTAASACIENADLSQYAAVRSLGYIEEVGRNVTVGRAEANEEAVCTIQWLDDSAWEHLIRPAYTDVHGSYPEEEQEIMLSERALEALGIGEPEEGMEIDLNVSIGLFHTAEEKFTLSGWFMDYTEKTGESAAGYVSRKKMEAWGFDVDAESDILLRQSDHLDWRETEEKLYDDVQMNDSGQRIRVSNTSAYEAVRGITGGYETAVLGALVILSGMYFLIHNVMQISMAGDVRQLGLLNTVGTTEKQMRKIYYGQIFKILVPGVLIGSGLSAVLLLAVIPGILGAQYLNGYGGANELQIFRPGILVGSVIFTVILVLAASAGVIRRTVSISCVESVNYTGLTKKQGSRKSGRKVRKEQNSPAEKSGGKKRGGPGSRKSSGAGKKRSAGMEILYMAWRNLTRQKGKFILTVFSLFLGVEAFLGALVITSEVDYTKVIEKRPDFLIAGEFSEWGKEEGYGSEYKSRDAAVDPMFTEGGSLELLYDNEYDVAERENADMVWCDYYQDTINSQKRISLAYSCDPVTYVKGIMTQRIPGSLCNKLYRKKLFKMYADVSVVGANMWEDLCITIAVTHYARKIIHIAQAFYHYRVDSTISIVRIHSVEKDRKRSQDMIRNVEAVTNFLYGNNLINLYIPELYILQLAAKSSLLWQLNPPLKEWKSTFPEANQYINSSSFYSKSLQYCALYNCTWVYVIRDLVRSFCSRLKKRIYGQNKK